MKENGVLDGRVSKAAALGTEAYRYAGLVVSQVVM